MLRLRSFWILALLFLESYLSGLAQVNSHPPPARAAPCRPSQRLGPDGAGISRAAYRGIGRADSGNSYR